ncbi:MAG TPA: succinyl-diaminopimelate desuccinylase [Anaeromyxobacteraceae bacterium]|nr:succinyl-diaminopimelate desuccinylase [Anaeromyxobacteraceae bacterium]
MAGPDDIAEALAARTGALCAIPSPIGAERAICDEVERWARTRPFPHVRRVENSLVVFVDSLPLPTVEPGGEGRGEGGARPLLALCGHLDTVPVHEEDRGPPRREGGRLVAPGASDMKGGVAVAMELAERLPAARRFCDLALVLYAREEGPFLENELGAVLREVPELSGAALALCLEPTDNVLQLGCVGSIHATFTFQGRAAHSARPWQGANAVHAAGPLLAELLARAPREAASGGLLYREVATVTRIEGGRARNVVPDRCTLNLNYRFAPDKALDAAAAEVRALAARFGAEVELTDLSPSCPAWADHPLVRRLVERTGVRAEPKQAWTDVARLAQHGIPAANLGPGATSQAHQRGEWVELGALERGYRLYEAFLTS